MVFAVSPLDNVMSYAYVIPLILLYLSSTSIHSLAFWLLFTLVVSINIRRGNSSRIYHHKDNDDAPIPQYEELCGIYCDVPGWRRVNILPYDAIVTYCDRIWQAIEGYIMCVLVVSLFISLLTFTSTLDSAYYPVGAESLMPRFFGLVMIQYGTIMMSFIAYLSPWGIMGVLLSLLPRDIDLGAMHVVVYVVCRLVLVIIQRIVAPQSLFPLSSVLVSNIHYLLITDVSAMVAAKIFGRHLTSTEGSKVNKDNWIMCFFTFKSFIGWPFMLFTDVSMSGSIPVMVVCLIVIYGVLKCCSFMRLSSVNRCIVLACVGTVSVIMTVSLIHTMGVRQGVVEHGRNIGSCVTSEYSRLDRLTGLVDASKCPVNVMFNDVMYDAEGDVSNARYYSSAEDVAWSLRTLSFSSTYMIQRYNGYVMVICRHPMLGFKAYVHYIPQSNLGAEAVIQRPSAPRVSAPGGSHDILFYLLDGADRFIVDERMPKTINSLRSRAHSTMFNFTGYRTFAYNSLPNQLAMFSGTNFTDFAKQRMQYKDSVLREHSMKPRFVFDRFRVSGYDVAFLDEDCHRNSSRHYFGYHSNHTSLDTSQLHSIMASHACIPYWKSFNDKSLHCMLGETPFRRRFSYLMDYFNGTLLKSKGIDISSPRAAWVSTYEAHSRLPQMVPILDPHLGEFLEEFGRVNPHAIIIVMADHGLHYLQDDRAHEFPVFLMSVPDSFDGKLIDNMRKNEASGMQFTGFDVYCTLLDLVPPHNHCRLERDAWHGGAVRYQSLLNDVISQRTCDDVGIVSDVYCGSFNRDLPERVHRYPWVL